MNKKFKKILSIILAIVICLGSVTVVSNAETTKRKILTKSLKSDISVVVTTEKDKYSKDEVVAFNVEVTNNSNKDYENLTINMQCNWFKLECAQGSDIAIDKLNAGESKNIVFEVNFNNAPFFARLAFPILRAISWVFRTLWGVYSETTRHYVKIGGIDYLFVFYSYLGDATSDSGEEYTVTFDLNYEGADIIKAQSVREGSLAVEPEADREGYQLIGWYTSKSDFSEIFDFSQEIYKNTKLYARWYDENDVKDSDNDGLSDSLEIQFGSNPYSSDTDNDGVDDFNELNWLNTDPASTDNGKDDADNDGLTNAEESKLGTNPAYSDSDFDNLSDYDEIYTYNTNPLLEDTDGDGVLDGVEVSNNSNPLVKETEFKTEASSGEVNESNSVVASASVITDNDGAGTLEINEVTYSENPLISSSIPGYLGSAYDFSTDGAFESATLTFSYDTSLGTIGENFQPRIYYLNEETGELQELPNQTVENGKVSADVEHFSTYILLNKVEFDSVWDEEIKPVDYEGNGMTGIDVVFVIDSSGSMSGNDGNRIRHQAAKEFVDKLGEHDRAAVIDFDSSAYVYQTFTNDKEALYKAIDKVNSSGNTSLSAGINSAINQFVASSYDRTDAYKYIIFLTDGDGDYNSSYTTKALNNNIAIYTIGLGSGVRESVLKAIANGTGGKYYFASTANQLPDIYSDVSFETIDYVTDSNNDGISDYYTDLLNNGDLLISSGSYSLVGVCDMYGIDCDDWDGDGLLNGEEIQVVTSNYDTYVKMKSNPIVKDTDGDGFDDNVEVKNLNTNPLKFTQKGGSSVRSLMNDDSYVYSEQVNDKSIGNSIAGFFDWQKTDESKETFINYFYDYASEASLNNNAETIEALAKREKAWEVIETIVSVVKLGKGILDLGTDLSSYDSVVKGQVTRYNNDHKTALDLYNKKDYDEIVERYASTEDLKDGFDIFENVFKANNESAPVEKINSVVSVISTTSSLIPRLKKVKLPMGDKVGTFARKYQTWLGKRPNGDITYGTTISVVCDAVDLVTDIADLTNLYGKLQANSEAFNDYIELIEYVSKNGNGLDYVRVAAGDIVKIVLDNSNNEYFKQLNSIIAKKTAKTFINIAVTIVGDFCPYVKVAKLVIDVAKVAISLTGMTAYAKALVKSQCIDAISDGCCYYLDGLLEIDDLWYSYSAEDSERVNLYLVQLAQSRIVGEDSICSFLKQWSLGNWISKLITGTSNKEIEEDFSIIISAIYSRAKNLDLQLSKKLPRYVNAPGGGGGGGGGSAW